MFQDNGSKGQNMRIELDSSTVGTEEKTPVGSRWKAKVYPKVVVVMKSGPQRVQVRDERNGMLSEMLKTSLLCNYARTNEQTERHEAPATEPVADVRYIKATDRLRAHLDDKRKHTSGKITTVEFKISPALAEALLMNNPRNREVSQIRINGYARDMTSGSWQVSHQGIGLGPNYEVGDGQHRLHAIVKSGVSIVATISWYHEQADFDAACIVWDIGRKRSKANALELSGKVGLGRGKYIAATLEAMTYVDGRFTTHPSNEEIVQMYTHVKTSVDTVCAALSPKEFSAPTRAAFVIAHRKSPAEIEDAMEKVTKKIGYAAGSPLHSMVLLLPQVQRAKAQTDRTGLIKDVLSLLYKHVKNQPGVRVLKNNDDAYRFFLGDNFRETQGR